MVLALMVVGCNRSHGEDARSPLDVIRQAARTRLAPFASEDELRQFLADLAAAQERERERLARRTMPWCGVDSLAKCACPPATCESLGVSCGVHSDGCGGTIDCGPCAKDEGGDAEVHASPAEAEAPADEMSSEPASESITNVQHAGVDEGGIVKLRGDHLIVLRRGRLFTVEIGKDTLRPISSVDAFGPEMDPSGAWYDELLVSDDTIVVIGYSYQRSGTELGIFHIDRAGKLSYRESYQLRSNDYYSSRNYASRLIGSKLVFYAPLGLAVNEDDLFGSFPGLRNWDGDGSAPDFERTAAATNVYRPLVASLDLSLHSVTVCDLAEHPMECTATVVMGPAGRVFYVSPTSVYVWTASGYSDERDAVVYRMPLDGSAPTALRASGSPVDQFSFLEDDEHLNVLVRADSAGDGMWDAEVTAGEVALFRVPVERFDDSVVEAPASSYTELERPAGYTFHNRFVGDHVLYGSGSGFTPSEQKHSALFAYRYAKGGSVARLPLRHGVDRIEALGSDAIVIGSDGKDLHFSPIALGNYPWVARRYTRLNASQGELRSHGFFYRSDGEHSGVLGLPVRDGARPGYEHLFSDSASVLFLRNKRLLLDEVGSLAATTLKTDDDGCRASCVDWYGNARPLFVGKRVFALLGYEIVEGRWRQGRIAERRRVTFAPRLRRAR
jgi:hypothetical protein